MDVIGNLGRTALAGAAATGAVHGAMSVGRRAGLTAIHFPRALGSIALEPTGAHRLLGWALFVGNGVVLAAGYRWLVPREHATPGAFAALGLVHGVVAAAGASALGRFHPRPRTAGLSVQGRPSVIDIALLTGVHVLYGALLGVFLSRRPRG